MTSSSKSPIQSVSKVGNLDRLLRLKAQFCSAALQGHIAMQNDLGGFMHEDQYIVEHAYLLGELMFQKFVKENDVVRRFNEKLL